MPDPFDYERGIGLFRGVAKFEALYGVDVRAALAAALPASGSIALLYDDPDGTPHLWTGDSLFPGGVGNTFGDAAAFQSLVHDVSTKVFDRLPDETWFYPGHGNDSTLGAERPHLEEWRTRGW
jgi:glyoxylase-like metal-dependent hydrolase (beta-lactamase superfamily II)